MTTPRRASALLALVLLSPAGLTAQERPENATIHPDLLETVDYRMVGPYRGGRVTTVEGFPDDPRAYLMGTTGGGVWLTSDAGETWVNVTDGFIDVGSMGAVEVADDDPNVIWAGTGSAGIRGNVSTGRGVWRSTDRGESWSFVGLPEAGLIGKIEVHPRDADVAYVAALGRPFRKNDERGVYRTTDGGESWERVLFVADSVGAVDLAMNPSNPREIYAGMWRAERKPWTLIDASRDGGVWRTTDGGDSWTRLTDPAVDNGLPSETLFGRIGLAVSPADPERVWALINAPDPHGGIYRTDDGGESWEKINRDRRFRQRHWYYSHLVADPVDPNTVYVLNTGMYRSVDGGVDWERISVPHGDVHDLWIHPDDARAMVVGNDGGAQVSVNAGASWTTMLNQPTAEFYRLEVDNQWPYRLYGAQQDNSTISVASRSEGGLTPEQDWYSVGGAESGHISVHPHPDSAHIVWAGNYIGQIDRSNLRTGERRNMILYPQMGDGVAPRDALYRFQWNAPILISRHDPSVVYHASQYLHRTTDGGMSWETISPDLTTDNPEQQGIPGGPLQHDHTGVEVFNTIFALSESHHDPDVLWVGTDDGRVWITRDGGGDWTEITPDGMPGVSTVNMIDLHPDRPGRAAMAVYRYRHGDFSPYVFVTDDFGESWRRVTDGTNGIPADHPVRVVRHDPERDGLLFAGTEFGVFVSFDDGGSWQSLQADLPHTPVTDMRVHMGDLALSTQGRSFWILDDLSTLRILRDEDRSAALRVYEPRPTTVVRFRAPGGDRAPESPADGVVVDYWIGEEVEGDVTVEVLDDAGTVIRRYRGPVDGEEAEEADEAETGDGEVEPPARAADEAGDPLAGRGLEDANLGTDGLDVARGMNRFVWDRRYPGPDVIESAQFSLAYTGGAWAPPGSYRVRVAAGSDTVTVPAELRPDPRPEEITLDDLEAQFALTMEIRDRLTEVHDAIRLLRSVREQSAEYVERARELEYPEETVEELDDAARELDDALTEVEEQLIQTKSEVGQDPINFPPMLDDQLAYLYSHVTNSYGRPTEGAYARFDDLVEETRPLLERVDAIVATEVAAFDELLSGAGIGRIVTPPPGG